MRARLLRGVLFLMIGSLTLFLATCDKSVNSGFEDSIGLYSYLEPIEGASNATMIVNKGNDDNDSYFQVEISDIETNHLLKSGSHGAWCLEWRKPMRSNNDEHKGVKWYSSIGNEKWKPMNYFFSIKGELEAADPDLTFREVQAVVWSLAGYMGIALEFNLETLSDSELPGDLRTNGQPNFSKEKVLAIVDRVKSEYASPAKSKTTEEEGCIVGETEEDQQNVCVEPEPEFVIQTITVGGEGHSCGLDAIGNAYCWGGNIAGRLGDGTATSSSTPVPVAIPDGVGFITIDAGHFHTVALSNSGEAWAWGNNTSGELGNGGTTRSFVPVPVNMPPGVSFSAISAGRAHTVALSTTGELWTWGNNFFGRLGTGAPDNTISNVPVMVSMPPGVTFKSISTSGDHTVALSTSGEAWAWGLNNIGQLGDGTIVNKNVPVAIDMPSGVTFETIETGFAHNIALSSSGQAWAWGNNGSGQVGTGSNNSRFTNPVLVSIPTGINISAIGAGRDHTFAISTTGEAWAWGNNELGQLGNGTTTNSNVPIAVSMPTGVSFVSASGSIFHSVALAPTGEVWSWGFNGSGELGDGSTEDSDTPVKVLFPVP